MIPVGLALALLGCGGGVGGGSASAPRTGSTQPKPAVTRTTPTETATTPSGQAQTQTSPEQQPGGAGDEEPAATQALLSGSGGRVTPRIVRVPAFISIRVVLRSADRAAYALRFGDRTLRVSRAGASMSATFAGLRPGKALVGTPVGAGNQVRIAATAQPGP